jgi:hypothetical protein
MDWKEKSDRISAGYSVHFDRWANRRLGGRTQKQVDSLISQAAKSATVCANCFRPLSPTDSVTLLWHQFRRESLKIRVPICLICTLNVEPVSEHTSRPYYAWNWRRMRCLGCGQPMRIDASVRFGPPRTCCADCARTAEYRANNLRRRVTREPKTCPECGNQFTPKRSDAVTCSDRCRQARHYRAHSRQESVTPQRQ